MHVIFIEYGNFWVSLTEVIEEDESSVHSGEGEMVIMIKMIMMVIMMMVIMMIMVIMISSNMTYAIPVSIASVVVA